MEGFPKKRRAQHTLSEAIGPMGRICNGRILCVYVERECEVFIHHTTMKKFTNLFEMKINLDWPMDVIFMYITYISVSKLSL